MKETGKDYSLPVFCYNSMNHIKFTKKCVFFIATYIKSIDIILHIHAFKVVS